MYSKKASLAFKEKINKLLYNFIKSFIILKMLPSFCFLFPHRVMFCSGCFRQVLFWFERQKKVVAGRVRQVVVLYSNDCMKMCWVRLSIGRLRRVVVFQRRSFEQVWLYHSNHELFCQKYLKLPIKTKSSLPTKVKTYYNYFLIKN